MRRSDQKISDRAAREDLWLWPLSTAYLGKKARQGFILGFASTKAEEMPRHVQRLERMISA